MNISFIVLIVTGLFIYNTYHDNFIIKSFGAYKKYYKMAGIFVVGLGFYLVMQRNPVQGASTIKALNQYINVMPIDKNSKNLISPFLSYNQSPTEERGAQKITQDSRTHKRSVSETKKKYVASMQDWKCGQCNKKLSHTFEIDHKIRLEHGGGNDATNLVALCRECHGEKTALENM